MKIRRSSSESDPSSKRTHLETDRTTKTKSRRRTMKNNYFGEKEKNSARAHQTVLRRSYLPIFFISLCLTLSCFAETNPIRPAVNEPNFDVSKWTLNFD